MRLTGRTVRIWIAIAVGFAAPAAALAASPSSAQVPQSVGEFQILDAQPSFTPIHAALLHTGRVWLGSGSGNDKVNFEAGDFRSFVLDPVADSITSVSTPWDLFCAGQSFLPDGRLVIAGGTEAYPEDWPASILFQGSRQAYTFDPITESYSALPAMHGGRWYPTLVSLGTGRIYATAGINEAATQMNVEPEVLTPVGPAWIERPPTDPWPTYPALFLTRGGKLFYSGGNVFPGIFGITLPPAGFLDVRTSNLSPVTGLTEPGARDQSASVLLPPAQDQRVMILGGGSLPSGDSLDSVDIIDLTAASPAYSPGPPLLHARMHANAVLLPDRTVFVTGGGAGREMDPVYESEIYDPLANTWTAAASSRIARLYHSFALLLPDGRVLIGGSNPPDMEPELRLEVYSPPYLFAGARPVITQSPAAVDYGDKIRIQTTQNGPTKWVSLIRPSAATHSLDTEQRVVDVHWRQVTRTGLLELKIPSDPNIAPPGWYMLFVTNSDGIPSEARWIKIG
jgi:hypothetical protein